INSTFAVPSEQSNGISGIHSPARLILLPSCCTIYSCEPLSPFLIIGNINESVLSDTNFSEIVSDKLIHKSFNTNLNSNVFSPIDSISNGPQCSPHIWFEKQYILDFTLNSHLGLL